MESSEKNSNPSCFAISAVIKRLTVRPVSQVLFCARVEDGVDSDLVDEPSSLTAQAFKGPDWPLFVGEGHH